jgi:hypothetical protein
LIGLPSRIRGSSGRYWQPQVEPSARSSGTSSPGRAAGGRDDLQLGEPALVGDRFVPAQGCVFGVIPDAASMAKWSGLITGRRRTSFRR